MKPLVLASLVVVLAIATPVAACGADEEQERRDRAAERRAAQQREAQRRERERQRRAEAAAAACEQQLEPLLDALREINSRLNVGLSYDDYTDAVGDVFVAYDEVFSKENDAEDPEAIDAQIDCLTQVGLPAEAALKQYQKAAQVWGDCFEDLDCSNDEIDSKLQRYWLKARDSLEDARDALDDMAHPEELASDDSS